jgi:hypothetical protein
MAGLKARLKQELKNSWKNKDVLKALQAAEEAGEEHPAAGAGGQYDPFGPLLDALRSELAGFKDFLQSQTDHYMNCLMNKIDFKSPFGDPLGPEVDARYEFWPQRKKQWPLLYYCATQVLAGSKASSCSNERSHSVSGRICSKLRGALLPNTVEQLTLAYHYIRREVIAVLKSYGSRAVAILDEEDFAAPAEEDCEYFLLSPHPPHAQSHATHSTSTFTCAEGTPGGREGRTCTLCVV